MGIYDNKTVYRDQMGPHMCDKLKCFATIRNIWKCSTN